VPNDFKGKTDRELYTAIRRTSAELMHRFEQHLELVPSRPGEREAGRAKISLIQLSAREFRGLYEKCRDLREIIEDGAADWDEREA
jgi:hypothetical protein